MTGVTYDPATGVLSYDGSGSGSETATVYLTAPTQSARSASFNVRVLQPTMVWGVDAARRFPGVGLDSASVPFSEMQKQLRARATYDAPNVLLISKGTYEDEFYIGPEKLHLYLLGEPTERPVLRNGQIGLIKFETAYLKNLNLWNTSVGGGGYLVDRKVNLYATKIYQHDSTREGNGFASPNYEGNSAYGIVLPPGEWRHWMWNFHGSQMGGKGNTTHQFYIEGRPNTYLLINNIRISGTRRCSAIKSTRFHNVIRNSYLSALQDPARPEVGLRGDKMIDIVSVGETVIYNNELIGAWNDTQSGVNSALVHFRARRDWWSSDSPAYPDVSYSPARTSLVNGGYLAPPGFSAGPETFVNPAFWEKVRSYDLSDPKNPYSFKKYIAYNTFRWLDEGFKRGSPIRDDGTSPRSPVAQFSIDEYWGTVPANWAERSVTFAANNRYIGWKMEDTTNSSRWIDMVWSPPESQVTLVGPGPWAYPAPPRTMVEVGGDSGPTGSSAPVVLPDWFRK